MSAKRKLPSVPPTVEPAGCVPRSSLTGYDPGPIQLVPTANYPLTHREIDVIEVTHSRDIQFPYVRELCAMARRAIGDQGALHMAVVRLGGEVEGRPTGRHNFLQRIDELRELERRLARRDPR